MCWRSKFVSANTVCAVVCSASGGMKDLLSKDICVTKFMRVPIFVRVEVVSQSFNCIIWFLRPGEVVVCEYTDTHKIETHTNAALQLSV